MSTGKIENQILDAVQTIVDNSIAHAGFDRTIQAQIARCANENQGKYVIKYQDGLFYAYSSNIETIYKKGDNVYILIPRNDMSETKTILGLVSNLGADYITNIKEEDKYETVGNDCAKKQESIGLCSYIKNQEIDLYNANSTPAFREGFEFDLEAFNFYLKKSDYFRGGADFRTALPEEQRYSGDYGIAYELVFKDATGSEKVITYKINIDDMEGNPYLLTVASKQYCIWEIDTENFIRLQRVYVFQNSFPNQKNDKVNDIFITNVELMGVNAIPTDEASNCSISIITKKGIYFDDNDLSTDTRTVEPVIRAKGNIIASNSSLLKYYWFKENNSVNYNSILFQRYGGPGWECINDFNTIEEGIREWLPGNSILSIQKSEATAKENTYKCVVIYNEKTILTKEFTIYNNSSSYDVTIQASNGTQFYYDSGETTLTCLINGQEQIGDDYQYDWSIVNNFGEFSSVTENSNKVLVQAKTINNYSLYKCIVSYKNNKIGKAEVIIKNSLEGGYAYTAIINNGNQIFKYDEKGISPASEAANMPIIIQPLDFTVYDDNGAEVPQSAIGNQNVEWWVPAENTMINVLNSYGAPERIEDGYKIYSNTYSIGFDILKTYNPNNNNNTILLKVFYKDKKLIAKTNFNFLKEGENGTNGSEFVCRLVPNTTDVTIPKNVILTYNETGSADDYLLNYNRPAGKNNIWLNAELYHNGVNIFRGSSSGISNEDIETNTVTLTWSILRNKYDYDNTQKITYQDDTNLTIDAETGAVNFSATEYSNPANIIKCTIIYNNVEYVATMPIIISRVTQEKYSLALKENTGFLSAMYTTDGQNPIYNNIAPYELILKENGEEITKNKNLSYDWSIKGRIYLSEWQSDSNLIIRNIASPSKVYEKTVDSTYQSGKTYYKYENSQYIQLIAVTDYPIGGTIGTNIYEARIINNIKYIKPKDTFDGMCVSNGIYCSVKNNNVEIANIHIPVYLYLNRYGNAAINGWDGNTISINDEAGIILSPQVGAGQKESDNSFTGVLMGSVKESGSKEIETGLFGYHAGQRTIKLDSKTGSAEFGTKDSGKIVIAPNEGVAGHAYLRSGDYELSYAHVAAGTLFNNLDLYFQKDGNIYTELKRDKDYVAGQIVVGSNIYKASTSGSGMEIDLTDPHIRFGSGKFRVDSDGSVHASEYALTSTVDSVRSELQDTKNTVTDLEDSVHYFEISSDTAAINIPCDTLQIPISKTVKFPINFIGTFKGINIPLLEGTEIGQCNITIEGNHTGLTLTKNFSKNNQQIIINADNTHIISDLVNDYTITFVYKESATKTYEVKKQFSVVLAIQGKNGAPGEQGPAGPAGKDGTSVTVKGSYNTLQELLNAVVAGTITPKLGDSYIIGNDLFIYTNEGKGNGKLSTDWKNVGQFKGTDAKRCFIVASTEIFRSDDGGSIYTPSEIILTPYFQSVEYQGWSYSTQGGADNTFIDISAPIPSGLSINTTTKKLTIQNDCELFNSNLTLVFKCRSNDGTTFDTISISKFKDGVDGKQGPQGVPGKDGEKGDTGIGVQSIVEQYYLSTSKTEQKGGSWKETQDPWVSGKYIWTRSEITWTDGTITHTDPVLADALNKANTTANTANTNASNAVNTANTASSTANTAKNTANQASQTATNANKTAGEAKQEATAATNTANTASQTANNAITQLGTTKQELAKLTTVVNNNYKDLQGQIDGAISTWFYNYEPNTPNTLPTKNWTTDTIKDQHLGDLFYIVDNDEKAGQCYRYAKVDNVYKWIIVEDVEVAKAIADAATAQATADGKATIYTGSTTPIDPQNGDLWMKSANDGILTYVNGSWIEYNKYTDDTLATEAKNTANTAKNTADTAKNTADSAKQTANSANQIATNAHNEVQNTVKQVDVEYYIASSETEIPTSSSNWTTTAPQWSAGKFIWSRQKMTFVDTNKQAQYSEPARVTGATGKNGAAGASAIQAILTNENHTLTANSSGVISSYTGAETSIFIYEGSKDVTSQYTITKLEHNVSGSLSGTKYTVTSVTNGIGGTVEIIATKGSTVLKKVFTVSVSKQGTKGDKGDKGATGNGISSVDVYYYLSTSATSLSGGSWSTTPPAWVNGKYMWSKTKTTYTNGSSKESEPVCITGAKGSTGSTGATGTGVESITEEYYLSTSKTAQSGGSWVTTPPAWVSGKYIWTRSKIVYKNPASTVYTTPVCSSEWEAANAVDNRISDKENHFNFKYYTDVIVYGDTNKFYPVIIKAGDQNVKRTIMVKRGYNERAPKEWNKQTHPGSLTLKILCNFGGWGGANYSWEIAEFEEMYSHIFGGATLCGNFCMFAIFLRGGGTTGAIYHLYSDQSLTANIYNYGWDSSINKYRANVLPAPQISYRTDYIQYKSDLCFGNPGNKTQNPAGSGYYDDLQYKVDAPEPRAMVANGTTEGGFTKYLRTSSQNEEIRIRNYVKLTQDSDKKLVSSTTTEYYLSTSNSTLTGGSWVTTLPAKISNTYLWTRQKIIYKDGSSITSTATCLDNKSGSRNLLIGTATATGDVASGTGTLVDNLDLFDGLTGVKTNTAWQERYVNLKSVYERNGFRVGDILTLSVYVKSDSATTKNFGLFRASSNSQNDSYKTINLTSNWQQIYFTFVASDYSKTATTTRIECSSASDTNYIYWAGWKLEKGNIASDWTPAPEDINESIGDVSDIANKANLTAGEAKSDAKNALDQSGEATRKADGALENVKQVENKANEMKVKATTFEYYIVKYEYKEEKKGNLFKSNLIYYSKNNNQYTKVRPNLDKTNHLTDTYYIKDDSSIQKPSSNLSEGVVYKNKPQWQDGFRIYRRTVITYNNGTQARSDWDLMDDYQTVDDIRYLDGNEVLKTMRGTNNIFYNSDGFYCYDGATKNDSTHAIILNHNGICFQERSSIKDPWPEPTSVWNINGTFDAKQINVINLTANAIANGILTLGSAAQDGGIVINDDQGRTKFELNSQRFCCHLNNGGYVLIGKDIGIQVLSSENEVQWGSSLVWTSITGNGTIKYENNVNYYLTKGNFNSLIIPETPEKIIPNGKTVYTINCGNIIEVKQQKIMDSLFFGDYIQTININTIDSKGKAHKGVAFIAKQ